MSATHPTPQRTTEACAFLRSPSEIHAAIAELTKKSPRMKLAVAYISPHWRSVFANYIGTVQVICWLDSTNTNPNAVEEIMKNSRFMVRQAHSMHAKVYLAPGIGAVVGSANLSSTALNDSDTAGKYEAAVLVKDVHVVHQIAEWFEKLWQSADVIEDDDLTRAKEAFARKPIRGTVIPSAAVGSALPPSTISIRTWNRMFAVPSSSELARVKVKREGIFKRTGQWFDPSEDNNHLNVYNELWDGRERNFKTDFTDSSRFGTDIRGKLRIISRLGDATGKFVIESSGDFVRLRHL